MKKQLLVLMFVAVAGMNSFAQCDKKIIITSAQTEHLDAKDEVQKTDEELTTVEYNQKEITITPGDHTMEGTINSITCDWSTPFKVGKTVIKTTINNPDGQSMNFTITIEGKDGKISFLVAIDEMPDRKIRLTVDKFEEKK